MHRLIITASLFVGAIVLGSGATEIDAADIDDFEGPYFGGFHHTTSPSGETGEALLTVSEKLPNGKFNGTLVEFPISGKVNAQGKVIFSGQIAEGGEFLRFKKGKAQLSATGRFVVGSVTIETNAFPGASGNYVFALDNAK